MFRQRRLFFTLGFLLLILASAAVYRFWPHPSHPDVLWHILSEQCLPNQRATGKPLPCAQVDEPAGFVVLKDRNGPLQYLLIPSAKITGMESPQLLKVETPNFFSLAWQARHFMAEKRGMPIDDSNISLAINSEWGRTQNQLHIHISCLLPEVKNQLSAQAGQLSYRWQPLPEKLRGHAYLARRVSAQELNTKGAFRLLAEGVPQARENMGHFGLAMTVVPGGEFLLLASQRNLLTLNLASVEEIQDHRCAVLDLPPAA
ncbi:CDP-diacylglycerol diphosphatase [Edaphovirga cremea]|uniref:CDP-diacylglycerol diphosphatase n=1 Tax=Edaphovirga cremea TaxID=2267246 RepID=UPI000DEF9A5B|nr:CDP-diacylglycerol diphosphatase [Edaphovirga cremea]